MLIPDIAPELFIAYQLFNGEVLLYSLITPDVPVSMTPHLIFELNYDFFVDRPYLVKKFIASYIFSILLAMLYFIKAVNSLYCTALEAVFFAVIALFNGTLDAFGTACATQLLVLACGGSYSTICDTTDCCIIVDLIIAFA